MALWPIYVGLVFAFIYSPIVRLLTVTGTFRPPSSMVNIHGHDVKVIHNSLQCEDIHWHRPSEMLYAACAGANAMDRYKWFPPLAVFKDPSAAQTGSIYGVDPKTLTSKRLELPGFRGPFVTHGIDVVSAGLPGVVNIFAVNHLPNPEYDSADATSEKARSQVEVFRYTVGKDTAEHMRSIIHPLIRTPNDILATSPHSFYVTNDFYYREGVQRELETVLPPSLATWTDVVHIDILDPKSINAAAGLKGEVALPHVHMSNGIGRASQHRPEEVLIVDAAGGYVTRTRRNLTHGASPKLTPIEQVFTDSTLDNPSYYDDPYATPGNNASGYVLGGLTRVLQLRSLVKHPEEVKLAAHVWHVKTKIGNVEELSHNKWEKRMIFADDGKLLNGATTAVMVPINPAENGGKKQALLFVTSAFADATVVTRVDL